MNPLDLRFFKKNGYLVKKNLLNKNPLIFFTLKFLDMFKSITFISFFVISSLYESHSPITFIK